MTETTNEEDSTLAIACTLNEQDLAQRSEGAGCELFAFAEQVEELPDGYAWRFSGDGEWHTKLLDFVAAERRCCGFFRIALEFAPNLGPVTLALRGPDGTKEFIAEIFLGRSSPPSILPQRRGPV